MAFCIDSCRFGGYFGRIWERFWKGFGKIFRRFFIFSSKTPIFKIRAPTQCFVRVELLKINPQIKKYRYKINEIFQCQHESFKITQKITHNYISPSLVLAANQPPSILISDPLIKSDSLEDKKTAAPTMSDGRPHLPTIVSFPHFSP